MDATDVTMLIGFLALAAGQIRSAHALNKRFDETNKETNKRFDDMNKRFDDMNKRFDDVNKRFDDVNKRFDETIGEMADLRERMARLEGSLDGFLAGRRDRDAA